MSYSRFPNRLHSSGLTTGLSFSPVQSRKEEYRSGSGTSKPVCHLCTPRLGWAHWCVLVQSCAQRCAQCTLHTTAFSGTVFYCLEWD